MENKFFEKNSDYFYVAFRVIIGILFFMHGLGKWGAVTSFDLTSLMFYAGVIEIVGGLFIAIGFMTNCSAAISAIQMAYAFIVVHAIGNNTINPLVNKGETALLFFAAFLVIAAFGARKWSIDSSKK